MSGLLRWLVAACACVAALADSDPASDNALTRPYFGYCHTETRGYTSRITSTLPEIRIPAGEENFTLDIPDKCEEQSMQLVGGVVTACDADAKPALLLAPMAAGPGAVRRRGARRSAAHCFVKLYCI